MIDGDDITIVGRLGKNPQVRYTSREKKVVQFDIATHEKGVKTKWTKIVALNDHADTCINDIKKGDKVSITGEVNSRETRNLDGALIKIKEIIIYSKKCPIKKIE